MRLPASRVEAVGSERAEAGPKLPSPRREAPMSRPIALSDEQLDIIRRAAEPLNPHDRGAYLQTVAKLLNGHDIGDGIVARCAREAQQRYLRTPDLSRFNGRSKYR
jgi:hypothetical protein